jgi:hypothetical protein
MPTRRGRGFTLLEALIGIGIVALVLAAVASLMMASFTDAARGDAKLHADSVATYAANRMLVEVREAKRAWFTPYVWEWGEYDTLWMVFPQRTMEGWYDRQIDGDTVAYFIWNDRLYRYSDVDGYEKMAEHVDSIGFQGEGDIVQVTVTSSVEGQHATRTEHVHLRNS